MSCFVLCCFGVGFYFTWQGRHSLLLGTKGHFGVNKASNHTYVEANKVRPTEYVVTADDHAQIRNKNVFQTANNGGCQSRVALSAQNSGVHEDKAKNTT